MNSYLEQDASSKGQVSAHDTGSQTGVDELADQLSALARDLQGEDDVEGTLQAIVRAAVDTVPGAQHASISAVIGRREVHTRASTDDLPRAVDQAQYETGEGPCLQTLYEEETVRLTNMASEQRWPKFTQRAAGLGVGSMLSVQLFVAGDDLGALNLLNEAVDAFTDESEHVALLFASHAAVAMAGAEQAENLRRAVSTRDLIGQAKGVLIERHKITSDQAFRLLLRASSLTNRKLADIAGELVRTGHLRGQEICGVPAQPAF